MKDLHPRALRVLVSSDLDADDLRTVISRGTLHRCWSTGWDPQVLRAGLRDAFRQWWTDHQGRGSEQEARAIPVPSPLIVSQRAHA